jgi:hypothetical protein
MHCASSRDPQHQDGPLEWRHRVATTKKQAIDEVVDWACGGAFMYGDAGCMTEADAPKLRAAAEVMAPAVGDRRHHKERCLRHLPTHKG